METKKMKEIIRELTKGIRINTDSVERIKKSKKTISYMNSLDFDGMPDEIKEMNMSLLENAKKSIAESKSSIISYDENYSGYECVEFASGYNGISEMVSLYKDVDCIDRIICSENFEITENVLEEIKNIREEKDRRLTELKAELKDHISRAVRKEYLDDEEKEKVPQPQEVKSQPQRNYTVRKTGKSPQEILDIILEYVRKNENIFNKIVFESKQPTLSVAERILDVNFKPGTGYIVNFISEPDTNYGKFYKNLLKVFNEIKEYVFDNFDIVLVPEDGKTISYLNSFYQNYIFVREKIDTALTQFKLQNSLLNENFSVKYLIFEKITGKYLIFYTGNKDLSRAVEPYFQNQAKLGTMMFEIEFVEYSGDIRKMIIDRLDRVRNRIELSEENNYMKLTGLRTEDKKTSLITDITGVKILIDPEYEYDGSDIDIVIMTNALDEQVRVIPQIMSANPNAKLFTSDISFKIARIKWMRELNNPSIALTSSGADFSRRDVDNLNERVIRITPMGKGYNFKGLVNIKFFSSGSLPGSSIVELRDSSHKTVYLNYYSSESSGLLKGSDTDISDYDFIIASSLKQRFGFMPVPYDQIKSAIDSGRQVFIFTDSLGNLQHLAADLFQCGIDKQIISGETVFGTINKELSKLLNFGSSWGDNFEDKELFHKSISRIEPLADEYEFYKKFSTNEPGIFLLPFEKMEVEMVLKNKLNGENVVLIPAFCETEFLSMLEKDVFVADENKTGKHIVYNYIRNDSINEIYNRCKDSKQFKKIITDAVSPEIPAGKLLVLEGNEAKTVYGK
jgi:hypothetical protein